MMFKSFKGSLIEFIFIVLAISLVLLFIDFPVWVDIVIFLPVIIFGILGMVIEKRVGKEKYKLLNKSALSRLPIFCCLILFFSRQFFPGFWEHIESFKTMQEFLIFFVIGASYMCYCAGMLSVIV